MVLGLQHFMWLLWFSTLSGTFLLGLRWPPCALLPLDHLLDLWITELVLRNVMRSGDLHVILLATCNGAETAFQSEGPKPSIGLKLDLTLQ